MKRDSSYIQITDVSSFGPEELELHYDPISHQYITRDFFSDSHRLDEYMGFQGRIRELKKEKKKRCVWGWGVGGWVGGGGAGRPIENIVGGPSGADNFTLE